MYNQSSWPGDMTTGMKFHRFIVLFVKLLNLAESLICNKCNQASLKEDCYNNEQVGRSDYVCFVGTQYITYIKSDKSETFIRLYSMGCQHYDLCRDGQTHGSGPYGYGITVLQCCCKDKCIKSDGVSHQPLVIQ